MYEPKRPMLTRESDFFDIVFGALRQAKDNKMPAADLVSMGAERLEVSPPTVRNYLRVLLYMDGHPLIKVGNMIVMTHMPKERPERYRHASKKSKIAEPLPSAIIEHRQQVKQQVTASLEPLSTYF